MYSNTSSLCSLCLLLFLFLFFSSLSVTDLLQPPLRMHPSPCLIYIFDFTGLFLCTPLTRIFLYSLFSPHHQSSDRGHDNPSLVCLSLKTLFIPNKHYFGFSWRKELHRLRVSTWGKQKIEMQGENKNVHCWVCISICCISVIIIYSLKELTTSRAQMQVLNWD